MPIDFFAGLGATEASLDPDKVPSAETLASLRDRILAGLTPMRLYSSPEGQRRRLGPTNAAGQLEGSQICEAFARRRPDLAAAAGEPAESWRTLIATKLAYLHAKNTVSSLGRRARLSELAVLQGLTQDVDTVLAKVYERRGSPEVAADDKNRLRSKFRLVRETSRLLHESAQAHKAQSERDAGRAAAAAAREARAAERLRLRTELLRRLNDGEIPALSPEPPTRSAGIGRGKGKNRTRRGP
jgi:hypothetical protein